MSPVPVGTKVLEVAQNRIEVRPSDRLLRPDLAMVASIVRPVRRHEAMVASKLNEV